MTTPTNQPPPSAGQETATPIDPPGLKGGPGAQAKMVREYLGAFRVQGDDPPIVVAANGEAMLSMMWPVHDQTPEGEKAATNYTVGLAKKIAELLNKSSDIEREPTSAQQELAAREWQPIATAPKDGSEILVYRQDAGVLLARWCAPCDFLTERELEEMPRADEPDWFCADFVTGNRLSSSGMPTHWMPLPEPPTASGKRGAGEGEA